jgi:transcriptional regulator with XRE-family HTH domain
MAKQRDKGKGGGMPEPWVTRLGDEVQFQREERHMHQADLAAATHVTPGMISQLENARVTPSADTMVRLARFLKLDLNRILGIRQPEMPLGSFGLPESLSDPVLVRWLAMIDRVWSWPPEQRQAVVSVWRALATAVEQWPVPGADPVQAPAQDPEDGTVGGAGPGPGPRSIRPSGTE